MFMSFVVQTYTLCRILLLFCPVVEPQGYSKQNNNKY
jgi:hypothetical protein